MLSNALLPKSLTLKKLSDTRCSARADATLALRKSYKEIRSVLFNMEADKNEKLECRKKAKRLLNILAEYEMALLVM